MKISTFIKLLLMRQKLTYTIDTGWAWEVANPTYLFGWIL